MDYFLEIVDIAHILRTVNSLVGFPIAALLVVAGFIKNKRRYKVGGVKIALAVFLITHLMFAIYVLDMHRVIEESWINLMLYNLSLLLGFVGVPIIVALLFDECTQIHPFGVGRIWTEILMSFFLIVVQLVVIAAINEITIVPLQNGL